MKAIAEDASVSDDVKAKLYGQALAKFRRMNTKPAKINNEQSNTVVAADASDNDTVNNLIDFDTVVSPPKKQKKTKKRHSTVPYAPALRSTRSYKRKAMKVSDMDFIEI
jgi:putative NADH-flavin reductase